MEKRHDMTWREFLIEVLKEENKPLQRKDIEALMKGTGYKFSKGLVGVIISTAVKDNLVAMLKYDGIPAYYCSPDWVEDGKLKEGFEFTPKWDNFKQPTI